ncbi:hypothetical protein D0Z07_1332 [Hyphodiscus hymeniophilus]|uniref:DRBM domain-containing protein n=1 Tax=Hyphodiscus hymeniophilus TaxID=353542 RepID=A0A9P6VQ93_9HELO|nr:hypothetical protein D0Z07_1332 [Hyphodiscus hymeniophilus]
MEPANGSASAGGGRRAHLQSIEDFMREQDEADADATRSAVPAADPAANPTRKQKKALLQEERERLEAEQKAKKATLETERKCIEQQANDAVTDLGAVNWVGKLLELIADNGFRVSQRTPHTHGGLTYAEQVVGSAPARFTCTALILESSQHFGKLISFSNKKDAKRHASKKAVDWLIENNYMPADGSVRFPKAAPPPVVKVLGPIQAANRSPVGVPSSRVATSTSTSTSYAGQVPELCNRLGFHPPTYEITKDSENVAFWSGHAHFGGDPRIEGKVGEVKSVFGKGNAKEQIAMEVLSFLRDIERLRMEGEDREDEDGEEDRKRKRESMNSGIDETAGKVVKVEA